VIEARNKVNCMHKSLKWSILLILSGLIGFSMVEHDYV